MPTHKTCAVCARKFVVFLESKYSRNGYCGKTCSLADKPARRKRQNREGSQKRKRKVSNGKSGYAAEPEAWEVEADGLELFAALKRGAANEQNEADEVLLELHAALVRARRDWTGNRFVGDTTGTKEGGLREYATARAAGRFVMRVVR